MTRLPEWLDPTPWLELAHTATPAQVRQALAGAEPGERELAALLSPAADAHLEELARRALSLTRRHFGRTVSLYAPLYLSNYCSGGCLYCGFAADRRTPRRRLEPAAVRQELAAMRAWGCQDVLLLTGERTAQAGLDYLAECVGIAAAVMPSVQVEVFPMPAADYRRLADQGCTGVTIYQETYDPARYDHFHRWGPKKDFAARLDAPARALAGGLRQVGLGALLGLSDPAFDMLALYRHLRHLRQRWWRAGVSLSFPRIRPQAGGFQAEFPVDDRFLARIIWAFRLCLPDVPLVLSTRESPAFRDGMAGVGINRMSVNSRTTVGGYAVAEGAAIGTGDAAAQFEVSDGRDAASFCAMLRARALEPVFKNADAAYREPVGAAAAS
ncbi:MAG: 2-iminoacetate synthase ThiH [Lentisphaeria bacterium]|jgi:2-iminoacetate synthase